MSHLTTTIKIKADCELDAISTANDLLTNGGEYTSFGDFDYVSDDMTEISKEITNDIQFNELRQAELSEYKHALERAEEEHKKGNEQMEGFYYQKAGQALDSDKFWSTERQAYDYTDYSEGNNVYYVSVDRHY